MHTLIVVDGTGLPRRLASCRVARIEDLAEVKQLVASSRVAFVELVPDDDETIDQLDAPLHSVADRRGGRLLLVEHNVVVQDAGDVERAVSLASDALTRVEMRCCDDEVTTDVLQRLGGALRKIGGGVWSIDEHLYVAAPFDIVNGPPGGRGPTAGDRAPLLPVNPALTGAAALPLPHD